MSTDKEETDTFAAQKALRDRYIRGKDGTNREYVVDAVVHQLPERIVFDDTRHVWMCTPPYSECPKDCVCRCHRTPPDEPSYIHGWVRESEL